MAKNVDNDIMNAFSMKKFQENKIKVEPQKVASGLL